MSEAWSKPHREGTVTKSYREIMEILEAFDLCRTFRGLHAGASKAHGEVVLRSGADPLGS